ncbi:hypothetical protein [Oceanithermus sp.]
MKNAAHSRQQRSSRYQRLAALHGGALGAALLGRPDLAGALGAALERCPGHENLICGGRGGRPRVCFVAKLEQMERSVVRGGEGRRAWEERFLREEVSACLEAFAGYFPAALEPVLSYAREEVAADMEYLRQVIAAG